MSQHRITDLHVESFRGATTKTSIRFENKPLVVVFGENGTGKTTLVDALDLIANNRVGSIEDRSSASMKHAPSIGREPTEIKVILERGTQKWEGTFSKSKASVTPSATRPQIGVLRRSQLLRLVEAQPAKRYDELKGFIDVSGVATSENELEAAVKSENASVTKHNNSRIDAEQELKALWQENGIKGEWKEWAKEQAKRSTDDIDVVLKEISSLVSLIESHEREQSNLNAASEQVKTATDQLAELQNASRSAGAAVEDATPQLIETLSAASSLMEAGWDKEECPVCQQKITPDELRNKLNDSMSVLQSAKVAHEKKVTAERTLATRTERFDADLKKERSALTELLDVFSKSSLPLVEQLGIDYEKLLAGISQEDDSQEFRTLLSDSVTSIHALKETVVQERDAQQRIKNQLNTIQRSFRQYGDAVTEAATSFAIHQKLNSTLATVRQLRIEFVQKILDEVSSEAERLYSSIHPKEDTKSGRLELDTKKRGSLLQYADFAGHKKVEPQGYFSDSHLDTLGFCYWLALAKRTKPEAKVIVLDDVFTSVDAAHLGRIVELIDNECGNFAQVIVFTHSRNWRDRYRYSQAAGKNAHILELRRWTPLRGISHSKTPLEIEELATLVQRFIDADPDSDRQEIASRCGILLEAILSHLSIHYQLKVPHRPDGEYTLGDLLNGCQSLMKVLQVQYVVDGEEGAPEVLQEAFKRLCEFAFIRNQVGCHFNLAGAQIVDSEVEQFGEATLSFARLVVCPECGEVPRSDKSLFRQCSCKKTRLLPAKT